MKKKRINYTVEDLARKIGNKAARGFFINALVNPDNGSTLELDEWFFEDEIDCENWRKYNHSFYYERKCEQWDAGLHPLRLGGALCYRCSIEKNMEVTHAPERNNDPYPYVGIDENLLP